MSFSDNKNSAGNSILCQNAYESSLHLEELVHDARFSRFMEEKWKLKSHHLEMSDFIVFRDFLPPEVIDAHYFPDRIKIRAMDVDLTELRGDDPEDASWSLSLRYSADSGEYEIHADGNTMSLKTESVNGDALDYTYDASVCPSFLVALICSLTESPELLVHLRDKKKSKAGLSYSGHDIGELMRMLGNLNGKYDSSITSPLLIEYGDRSLLLKQNEIETPESSEASVSVFAAHEVTSEPVMYSFNHHVLSGEETSSLSGTTMALMDGSVENLDEILAFEQVEPTIVDPGADPEKWQIAMATLEATLSRYSPR